MVASAGHGVSTFAVGTLWDVEQVPALPQSWQPDLTNGEPACSSEQHWLLRGSGFPRSSGISWGLPAGVCLPSASGTGVADVGGAPMPVKCRLALGTPSVPMKPSV